jgi:uncharacterized membrane protein (UPF0182 family)
VKNSPPTFLRSLLIAAAVLLGLAALLAGLCVVLANYLVDIYWFDSLGYEFYYWQRLLYRYAVFISVSVVFFLIFFLNFLIASRHLGTASEPYRPRAKKHYQRLYHQFQTGSLLVYTPLSMAFGIPVAFSLYQQWESFLFYIFGPATGIRDSIYGKDVSYYLFSYPIYILVRRQLLIAFLLLLAALSLLYVIESRVLVKGGRDLPRGAKWHLSIIILLIFGIELWDFQLQLIGLVYDTDHMPLFFGPGYVQMNVIYPLIWIALILLAGTALMLIIVIHRRKGLKILGSFAVAFCIALILRNSTFLPQIAEKYLVKPNEFSKEKPFISDNIQATLQAYGLTDVEIRDFHREPVLKNVEAPGIKNILRNIPVWEARLLETVFSELQALRTYYTFPRVSVGRYTVEDKYSQVFLAPREYDYRDLPAGAHNWINEHLTYTHGYGAVMTPASQEGETPITWYIYDIPPQSDYGFHIEEPGIYYGLGNYTYVIAPNRDGELDYPLGNRNVISNYHGKGGVPITPLGRLLFSYYFKDKNILFSIKIIDKSKILFRRNIVERIHRLAPYLLLDQTPYAVVTSKGIYWIQDAYTTSSWYPDAASHAWEGKRLNYIRNSVKIVVDAYNGSVDFYIFDENDPIIRAYSRIYPGLFKPKDQMPADIRPHVRWPKDLFDIQMHIYANYHQTDPYVFYQQEDIWEYAYALSGKKQVLFAPYYLTLDLIRPPQLDFLLLVPMIPRKRENLRVLAVAGCDQPNYGKIIIYNFPKGELFYGPTQVTSLINEEPSISQQFTLWDQAGSSVDRGKMIIFPLQNNILYIQPVYLITTLPVKIPELQRVIMSQGEVAVMESSLEKAYKMLQKRMKKDTKALEKEFPLELHPPAPDPEPTIPGGLDPKRFSEIKKDGH